MTNILSFAVFNEARVSNYVEKQLLPSFKKKLDAQVLMGSIKDYQILNADDINTATLKVTNYKDNSVIVNLEYEPDHQYRSVKDDSGKYVTVDFANKDRKYYSVRYYDKRDELNYRKYSDFIEDAYKNYLKDNQVKKLKVGGAEINKEEIIDHVENLPSYKKLVNDFDMVNVTTKGEAKNGTLAFYYKYQQENRVDTTPPYAMFKISGKGGNVYDTAGNGHTVVKYGPMQTIEDYDKAIKGLYDYLLNTYWRKKLKVFRKELEQNPYLQTSHPGRYMMMKRFDNPDLFRNDKLRNLINTGLFND